MSDLRDQLLKAGLVSQKQVRQAKHQDRLQRKELGQQGQADQKAESDRRFQEEREEKRRRDREREEAQRRARAEEEKAQALSGRIKAGWVRDATGGSRRFFFLADAARITYLDLTDQAVRRLLAGAGAIVKSCGAARGEFCVVDGNTAVSLSRDHPEVIRFWSRGNER
jgi:hypothetical protein